MNSTIAVELNYTILRDQRFGNNTGSSLLEIALITQLPVIFNCSTVLLLSKFGAYNNSNFSFGLFLLEFLCTISPLILFLTVLSDYIYIFYFIFLFVVLPISIYKFLELDLKKNWNEVVKHTFVTSDKLPCISQFRGVVNLYSVICILTADFTCFPERYLKTEFYGFSLMDTGVGLFVFAFSLSCNHFHSRRFNWFLIFRKTLPLLLIGTGRYISTVLMGYQHRLSEYGIHWNFFVTLFVLILFNEFLFLFIRSVKNSFLFSIFLLVFYECSLCFGIKNWIFGTSTRLSFISANREGVCSLMGFEVLYLWGAIIKSFLPKKGDSIKKYCDVILLYLLYFFVCIILLVISYNTVGISRRCANCGYVLWITSLSIISLIFLILFELFVCYVNNNIKMHIAIIVPHVIESVNYNGLIFFLLGNIITGIINLSLHTLMLSNAAALLLTFLYIACCCSVTSFLYFKNWRIR